MPARFMVRFLPLLLLSALCVPAAAQQVLVLDMVGDGVDLSAIAPQNDMFLGKKIPTRWTAPGSDDCVLVIDATGLQSVGVQVRDRFGNAVDGLVILQDGLSITPPGVPNAPLNDVWEVAATLDANHDGMLDAGDPAWEFLWLYMGPADASKLTHVSASIHRPPLVQMTSISLTHASPYTDSSGNSRRDGSCTIAGTSRVVTGALLQTGTTPARQTQWGALRRDYR